MSRKKVSTEAQIIALFTSLTDQGKQMVMFGLNAIISNEAPKTSAPAVRGSAPRRAGGNSTIKPDAPAVNGGSCTAKIPGTDDTCSKPTENLVHDPNAGYAGYHEFEGTKSKKAAAQK